jgi:hypothetical protein
MILCLSILGRCTVPNKQRNMSASLTRKCTNGYPARRIKVGGRIAFVPNQTHGPLGDWQGGIGGLTKFGGVK